MATVRMADYLRHNIVKKFRQLYDKSNPPIEQKAYHGDKLYETLLSGKIEKLNEKIVESFGNIIELNELLMETDTLKIKTDMLLYDYEREYDEVKDTHFWKIKEKFKEDVEIEVPLSSQSLMFCQRGGYYDTPAAIHVDELTNADIPDAAKEYIEKIKKNHQDESYRYAKKYIDSEKVDETLLQFTTLNQALKAWPALSKLVPQDKISKVHEKQQRKRKEQQQRSKVKPVEQNLNKTILTASLLGDD